MSQTTSNTLFFTPEQGQEIILKDSLFGNTTPGLPGAQQCFQEFRKFLEKDKKLELHAITLSDYWRKEIIPRGLRIKKFPFLGKDSPEFRNKWEAVLNKCSLDLMLLLIDELKKQRVELQDQHRDTESQIESLIQDSDVHKETFKKLKEDIDAFADTLAKSKLDKFKRDQRDYEEGVIYHWPQPRTSQRRNRVVSFSLPSSTSASEDDDPLPSTSDQHFLGQTRPQRGRRKRGGGGRGDYALRPRQTHQQHRT